MLIICLNCVCVCVAYVVDKWLDIDRMGRWMDEFIK